MKYRLIAITFIVFMAGFFVKKEERFKTVESAKKTKSLISRQPSSVSQVKNKAETLKPAQENSDLISVSDKTTAEHEAVTIRDDIKIKISELVKTYPQVKKYDDFLKQMGESKASMTVRAWFLLGLFIAPSQSEAELIYTVDRELRKNSHEVLKVLNEKVNFIRSDAFTEQMSLSIVARLEVDSNLKAEYYGKILNQQIQLDSSNQVTYKGTGITNALIYLREANVAHDVLVPILKQVVTANSGNETAKQEVLVRIKAYFPNIRI